MAVLQGPDAECNGRLANMKKNRVLSQGVALGSLVARLQREEKTKECADQA